MNNGATGYILKHWSGDLPLFWSFWINLILIRFVILYLERFTRPPFMPDVETAIAATIGFFVVCQMVVLPWQVVGVLRSCDRHLAALNSIVWVWGAQFGVAASLILTLISVYFGVQSLLVEHLRLFGDAAPEQARAGNYTLAATEDGRVIRLQGDFDFGITRDLEALLSEHRAAERIELDSDGGQIYEGRGVARLIMARGLDSHVLGTCKSACVTAFAGGATRTLGPTGRLGFHQYRLEAEFTNPLVDTAAEQEKDRRFYADRGIDAEFLRQVFDRPHDEIWFPTPAELLAAGVVHRIAGTAAD